MNTRTNRIVVDADDCLTSEQREAVAESLDPRWVCTFEPSSDGLTHHISVKHEDHDDDHCRGQSEVRGQLHSVLRALNCDRIGRDVGMTHSGGYAAVRIVIGDLLTD